MRYFYYRIEFNSGGRRDIRLRNCVEFAEEMELLLVILNCSCSMMPWKYLVEISCMFPK